MPSLALVVICTARPDTICGKRSYNVFSSATRHTPPATASKALRNVSGNSRPLVPDRRNIPSHAFALKKNRCGIEPVSSTCDNEDSTASLGHSEILSIENSPGKRSFGASNHTRTGPPPPIWRNEWGICSHDSSEEASKSVVFGAKDSGDIFPNSDGWLLSDSRSNIVNCVEDSDKFDCKLSTFILQRVSKPCNRKRLARCASYQYIRGINITGAYAISNQSHITVIWHIRVVVVQYSAWERLYFRKPGCLPPQRMPGSSSRLDA